VRFFALQAEVDPMLLDTIARIAFAQTVMAVVMVVLGLIVLGGAMLVLLEFRSLRRLLKDMLVTMEEVRPRIGPLLDRADVITGDLTNMSGDVRRRVDSLLFTIEDVNRRVQRGADAVAERAQRFDSVLDVVQTEAEELLLDAASTARGVHETARQLREPGPRARRRRPPVDVGEEGTEMEEASDE